MCCTGIIHSLLLYAVRLLFIGSNEICMCRPFPLAVYTKLLQCLERVASSSRALSNAMAAIGISIDNMAHEETVANLTALHAMNKHLREVIIYI